MCGIAGALQANGAGRELVELMIARLQHRGPDESGFFSNTSTCSALSLHLGIARLSIIDPELGHQPTYNHDRSIICICNGEIYNHQELRSSLEKDGVQFRSGSDAEVIPELYDRHGLATFSMLRGMFAIALYDANTDELILARDRFGIKPLHYLSTESGFYFASEIKALLLVKQYQASVDRNSLDELLGVRHIASARTLFSGICKLLPGSYLRLKLADQQLSTGTFYQFSPKANRGSSPSFTEAADNIRTLLDNAVLARLMSDVPLGISLSGGVDSCSVLASICAQSDLRPRSFSVRVEDRSQEVQFAARIARHFGVEHHVAHLSSEQFVELVPEVIWHLEAPHAAGEVPTYVLGQLASQHVKMILSGDGSDEVFGGYPRFKPLHYGRQLPSSVLKWGYARGLNSLTRGQRRLLYSANQRPYLGGNGGPALDAALSKRNHEVLNRFLHYETEHCLHNIELTRVDRMTMAHSVENRVPFLDTALIEYVSALPAHYKLQGLRDKAVLREAMKDRLPGYVLNRRKLGMGDPMQSIFRGDFRDLCYSSLFEHRSILDQYFRWSQIEQLFNGIGGRGLLSLAEQKIVQLYFFSQWHKIFVEGEHSFQ